jgi:hypothetical protein
MSKTLSHCFLLSAVVFLWKQPYMAITAKAPRGGIVEEIDGVSYTFLLRSREIERYEDLHRGIFDVWDGFFGRGQKPTSSEVKDIVALALVGGGKTDTDADRIVEKATPADLFRFYEIAQAALGVAFMPDAFDEAELKKKEQQQDGDSVVLM